MNDVRSRRRRRDWRRARLGDDALGDIKVVRSRRRGLEQAARVTASRDMHVNTWVKEKRTLLPQGMDKRFTGSDASERSARPDFDVDLLRNDHGRALRCVVHRTARYALFVEPGTLRVQRIG